MFFIYSFLMTKKGKKKDSTSTSSKKKNITSKSQECSLNAGLDGLASLGSLTISSSCPKQAKGSGGSSTRGTSTGRTGHSWEAVSTITSCRYSEGDSAATNATNLGATSTVAASSSSHWSINASNSSSISSVTTHSGGGGGGSPRKKMATVKQDIPVYANVKSRKGQKKDKHSKK